ncbi:hypothetical protein GJ496_002291 [Pomphorhynchus laevis]|nr:hypothetical protein GJ496_002291 [Pomphorhynchus laevis]
MTQAVPSENDEFNIDIEDDKNTPSTQNQALFYTEVEVEALEMYKMGNHKEAYDILCRKPDEDFDNDYSDRARNHDDDSTLASIRITGCYGEII